MHMVNLLSVIYLSFKIPEVANEKEKEISW